MKGPLWGTVAGLLLLLLTCTEGRYPLVYDRGHIYLEGTLPTGEAVRLLVDSGSDVSFLDEVWVRRVGGTVVPWGTTEAQGIGLSALSKGRARGVPLPRGLPPWLDGLMVHGKDSHQFFDLFQVEQSSMVGLIGLDNLAGWSLDFRGDRPWLVRGSVADGPGPARPRFDLYPLGSHWMMPATLETDEGPDGGATVAWQALIDSGSSSAVLWFHTADNPWPGEARNRHLQVGVNGLPVRFFTPQRLAPGDHEVSGLVVGSVPWDLPGSELNLGCPFLMRYRAVVDLGAHTITFDRQPRGRVDALIEA